MVRHSTDSHLLAADDEQDEHTQSNEQEQFHQQNQQNDTNNTHSQPAPKLQQNGSTTENGSRAQTDPTATSSNGAALDPHSRPSIEIQEPTPGAFHGDHPQVTVKKPKVERETAIDILYENERGGFLCGRALFSGQALGFLDVPPWTNAYHKATPSNINTAQVPDPSWEWVWPEWRVNKQKDVDDSGWEYSFAFSRKFSWHKGKWWNSFVRRRAWIRKRIKKNSEDDASTDPHMLSSGYFTVRPASYKSNQSRDSIMSARLSHQPSMSQISDDEIEEEPLKIDNIEDLLKILRHARIDREKLDAVENYLDNASDLDKLQDAMHDIMSLFVFQDSRRKLLGDLMKVHDETTAQVKETNTTELRERSQALKDAIGHADEEVRRLAYWSDIKQMAESGEAKDAVMGNKGWDKSWEGVDQSGGAHPQRDKPEGTNGT